LIVKDRRGGLIAVASYAGCRRPPAPTPSPSANVIARGLPACPAAVAENPERVASGRRRLRGHPVQRSRGHPRGNVASLRLAWTFPTNVAKGHEAAPPVVGDTMYVTAPSPDAVLALDLRANPPHARWTYRPEVEPAAQGVACLAIVFVFTTGRTAASWARS
jgi:hypothetical protein